MCLRYMAKGLWTHDYNTIMWFLPKDLPRSRVHKLLAI